jgi:hypothetical protein
MTFIKRAYLIFVLLPCAIIYASVVMIIVLIEHLIDASSIKKY